LLWGGAWTIGYKGWSAWVAKYLSEHGILVISPDYRNFPQGDIRDMLDDVDAAMNWIVQNCDKYGGNPENITLIGQSAGAHLGATALLRQALDPNANRWGIKHIKHFVGISGVYNIPDSIVEFDKRGLYQDLFWSIMAGDCTLYSPYHTVLSRLQHAAELRKTSISCGGQCVPLNAADAKENAGTPCAHCELQISNLIELPKFGVPPITLIHGTRDKTVDASASTQFASILQKCNVPVSVHVLDGKTHTDMFLEDQLEGVGDYFNHFLFNLITHPSNVGNVNIPQPDSTSKVHINHVHDTILYTKNQQATVSLINQSLLYIARVVNPF